MGEEQGQLPAPGPLDEERASVHLGALQAPELVASGCGGEWDPGDGDLSLCPGSPVPPEPSPTEQ